METHGQLSGIVGGPITFGWVKRRLLAAWHRLCARCGEGCVSGGSVLQEDGVRYIAHPCSVQMGRLAGLFRSYCSRGSMFHNDRN